MEFIVPEGWKTPSVYQETRNIGSHRINVLGLMIEHVSGAQVVGSAADAEHIPHARARAELYERLSLLEALNGDRESFDVNDRNKNHIHIVSRADLFPVSSLPAEWQYAKSNGVAWGETWDQACFSAECELFERDAILRSWYGEGFPIRLATHKALQDRWASLVDLNVYQFPSIHPTIKVVGVFGFPLWPEVPFIFGFAARPSLEDAIEKAHQEWQQRLAFLWGEPVQGEACPFAPTAEYHQEIYLPQEKVPVIKNWLVGIHCDGSHVMTKYSPTQFVNVTHEKYASMGYVVKALNKDCYPLIFGRAPYATLAKSQVTLLHPIG